MTRLALAALAALIASTAAAAPLEDAHRHFQRLEYDQALASLEEARRAPLAPRALADSWLLEGEIQVVLSRLGEARAAFVRALRLQPGTALPGSASPKLRTVFDEAAALESARRQRHAEVSIELAPPAPPPVASRSVEVRARVAHAFSTMSVRLQIRDPATAAAATLPMIAVDGSWRADIPAELVRPAATLSLRAELLDGGELVASAPADGQPAALVSIPPHRAAVRVRSPFSGAELSVAGHVVGTLPLDAPIPVEPGEVMLRLRGHGAAIDQKVEVRAGDVVAVTLAGGGIPARSIARATLLSVGAALLLAGGVLAYEADRARADLDASITLEPSSGLPATQYASVQSIARSGRAEAAASIATLALGGASAIAGLLLFVPRWRRVDGKR